MTYPYHEEPYYHGPDKVSPTTQCPYCKSHAVAYIDNEDVWYKFACENCGANYIWDTLGKSKPKLIGFWLH